MNGYYRHKSSAGDFFIVPKNGRWHALYMGEDLGSYANAQMAIDDLAGGHTFMPSCGDTEGMVPDDLSEWEFVPSR